VTVGAGEANDVGAGLDGATGALVGGGLEGALVGRSVDDPEGVGGRVPTGDGDGEVVLEKGLGARVGSLSAAQMSGLGSSRSVCNKKICKK
jgi:hypothetical protein